MKYNKFVYSKIPFEVLCPTAQKRDVDGFPGRPQNAFFNVFGFKYADKAGDYLELFEKIMELKFKKGNLNGIGRLGWTVCRGEGRAKPN